jgi:hypothetical protein
LGAKFPVTHSHFLEMTKHSEALFGKLCLFDPHLQRCLSSILFLQGIIFIVYSMCHKGLDARVLRKLP